MGTAASSFLKAFAVTPVLEIRSLLSALATKFQMWAPQAFGRAAHTSTRKGSGAPKSFSARGAAIAGAMATEEHGNDNASLGEPAGDRTPRQCGADTFPCTSGSRLN